MEYKYTFTYTEPTEVSTGDSYTLADNYLIDGFEVNSKYNEDTDFIELHYYSLDNRLLKSTYNYTNIQSPQDSETAGDGTLSSIALGVETDLKIAGYETGDVYLYYNILSDPYTEDKSST